MDTQDFEVELEKLGKKAAASREKIATEEAAKIAIVLPFFKVLGYNPYDPEEVIPEYTADLGIKRGEKVDFAITRGGSVEIVVECKSPGTKLAFEHASQLYRYFQTLSARIAILTNGFEWRFYTDSEKKNVMDDSPFLTFDISKIEAREINQIAKFRKEEFCLNSILETASQLKYRASLEREFRSEILDPSDEFVELLARRVSNTGRFTSAMRDRFRPLVKSSINEVLRESVSTLLAKALKQNSEDCETEGIQTPAIVTTEAELEGFRIVQAICAERVPTDRIFIRDQKTYCSVLLDDSNRKPIIRMWFNTPENMFIELFDGDAGDRIRISEVREIFLHSHRIKNTLRALLDAGIGASRAV